MSPRGWAEPLTLAPDAVRDLRSLVLVLLSAEVRAGPPRALPPRFPFAVWSDACEAGGACVIAAPGGWWAAWWPWQGVHSTYAPDVAAEPMFFLEARALLRALRFAVEDLGLAGAPLLLRCDNQPFVQAAVRGCSSTRLGNTLLAQLDAAVEAYAAGVAIEWVSTDVMLADPFSRIPLGVRPHGAGGPGELAPIPPPCDPHGRPPPTDVSLAGAGVRMINANPILGV